MSSRTHAELLALIRDLALEGLNEPAATHKMKDTSPEKTIFDAPPPAKKSLGPHRKLAKSDAATETKQSEASEPTLKLGLTGDKAAATHKDKDKDDSMPPVTFTRIENHLCALRDQICANAKQLLISSGKGAEDIRIVTHGDIEGVVASVVANNRVAITGRDCPSLRAALNNFLLVTSELMEYALPYGEDDEMLYLSSKVGGFNKGMFPTVAYHKKKFCECE